MASVLGFGEEIAVISNELLQNAIEEQAPEAQKAYGQQSGAKDADVLMLRLDLSSIAKPRAICSAALFYACVALNE